MGTIADASTNPRAAGDASSWRTANASATGTSLSPSDEIEAPRSNGRKSASRSTLKLGGKPARKVINLLGSCAPHFSAL
jgi:hypothetical protein